MDAAVWLEQDETALGAAAVQILAQLDDEAKRMPAAIEKDVARSSKL